MREHRFAVLSRPGTQSLACLLLLFCLGSIHAQEIRPSQPNNPRYTPTVEVVQRVKAAVVNIHSERTVSAATRKELLSPTTLQRVNGMGTGIVIDPRGYIVTNFHVVDEVNSLRVRLCDGTNMPAKVYARDPEGDLAIIKVDPPHPLPLMPLGTSSDLMLGEPVIAIGNAYGYEHTVTTGIVSAMKRDVSLNKEVAYKSLIQTDSSINPGNSGGPLLNVYGELIGVNVAIRAGAQGIGFALPVESMIRSATELLSLRKRIGFSHGLVVSDAVEVSNNPVKRYAVIEKCDGNTPAGRAGLQVGDVVTQVGEVKVSSGLDIERGMLDKALGDHVPVALRRGADEHGEGGQEMQVDLLLKGTEKVAVAQGPQDVVWKKLGLKLQPAGQDTVVKVNPQLRGGLLVADVNPESPAAKAGFLRGDILIGLHQWETLSVENVTYVLNHQDLATFAPMKYFRIRAGQLQKGVLPE